MQKAWEPMTVDQAMLNLAMPRAESDSAKAWLRSRQQRHLKDYNDLVDQMRTICDEMILTQHALGKDVNDPESFPEVFTRLVVNIGDGSGTDRPESYVARSDDVPTDVIKDVSGMCTTDPASTKHNVDYIREEVAKRDNLSAFLEMKAIARENMEGVRDKIEYHVRENEAVPGKREIEEAMKVMHRAAKRRRLSVEAVIEGVFYDGIGMDVPENDGDDDED